MKYFKRYYIIIFIIFVFIINVFIISPENVLASKEQGMGGRYYCPLCEHINDDDPLYEKERQFYHKIELLKKTYGQSIDEIVLAASVLHRYGVTTAYNIVYTEDFNEKEYTTMIGGLKKAYANSSLDDLDDDEKKLVDANEKYDLLTIAAIVMNDASKGGKYSDVCYKGALAGERLVANDSNGLFSEIDNAIMCAKTKLEGSDAADGDSDKVRSVSEKLRISNINSVCKNGYIGGLYSGISDIKDEDLKKSKKEGYAQEIIDLANEYKKLYSLQTDDTCASNIAGTTGDFSGWKQYDSKWGDITLGGSSSIHRAGCLVTSVSMQISRSGTKIGTLPIGYSDFNPGAFVTTLNSNGGFASGGNFTWSGFSSIAPNWEIGGPFQEINVSDNQSLSKIISDELSTPYDGKYQKFIVLNIHHDESSQHWVAVNGVENGVVTIFDPAANGTTLDDNYSNWVVEGYKVMYATDVMFGQNANTTTNTNNNTTNTTNTTNNSCSGSSGNYAEALRKFYSYIEGKSECNYRGQGEGTGYNSYVLNDGAGATTAYGLTRYTDNSAQQVGYTDFIADLGNGCTSKEYVDKMVLVALENFKNDHVDSYSYIVGVNLSDSEMYALTSIAWGGSDNAEMIIDAIANYGKESDQVLKAFKDSYGSNPEYAYGLGLRRLAEYEVFMTGNWNADKPYDHFNSDSEIQSASKSTIQSYWPTSRTVEVWDGQVPSNSGTSSTDSTGSTDDFVCVDGKAQRDNSSTGSA